MAKRRKLQRQSSKTHQMPNKAKLNVVTRAKPPEDRKSNKSCKGSSSQHKTCQQHEPATIPFNPQDHILLLGEGDLSFAASLVGHHGCTNVTATVLEKDPAELVAKYPAVNDNLAMVLGTKRNDQSPPRQQSDKDPSFVEKEASVPKDEHDAPAAAAELNQVTKQEEDDLDNSSRGSMPASSTETAERTTTHKYNKVMFNVDATKLTQSIIRSPHDCIIFNFPHVGGKSTDVNRQVRHNQQLLVSFFNSALRALAPGGSIVVTLFEGEPYTLWNIRDLGRHAGLQVERSFRFQPNAYPGYRHSRTLGVVRNKKGEVGGGWRGEDRPARSFVFRRNGEEPKDMGKKRKRNGDGHDDSSDEDE